jgi:linoleoyl-CoA desaturase
MKYHCIDGYDYDLSDLLSGKNTHPGGTRILQATQGSDVSLLFKSYHLRFKPKIEKYKVGPSKNLCPARMELDFEDPMLDEIQKEVTQYFKSRKLSTKVPYDKLCWLYLGLALLIFCFYRMMQGDLFYSFIFGLFYWIVGANVFHDVMHFAFSDNKYHCFFWEIYGLIFRVGFEWMQSHNILHHVYTNIKGYDPDIIHNHKIWRSVPSYKHLPYYAYQSLYYMLLWPIGNFSLYKTEYDLMMREKYPGGKRKIPRTNHEGLYLQVVFRLITLYVFVLHPLYFFGFKGILIIILSLGTFSFQFMAFSQVDHLIDETTNGLQNTTWLSKKWSEHQVLTSTTWGAQSWFWTLMSGGLNMQKEHHLFPGVNHYYLRQLQPIVKQACEKYGVKYIEYNGFWDVFQEHFKHIKNMGKS